MTLIELFNRIANAIREKEGSEELIAALDFPAKILAIQTGELTEEEYKELLLIAEDILIAPTDSATQMALLNEVMGTGDPYFAIGGTQEELEAIYNEILGIGGNG